MVLDKPNPKFSIVKCREVKSSTSLQDNISLNLEDLKGQGMPLFWLKQTLKCLVNCYHVDGI